MQEIEKRAKEMEELNENLFSKSFRYVGQACSFHMLPLCHDRLCT